MLQVPKLVLSDLFFNGPLNGFSLDKCSRLSCAENDLLDILAKADEDVKSGRVAPMKDTFDDLRNDILLSIKDRII